MPSRIRRLQAYTAAGADVLFAPCPQTSAKIETSLLPRQERAGELIENGGIPYSIVHATQFFEFIKRIADEATVGTKVRLPRPHG